MRTLAQTLALSLLAVVLTTGCEKKEQVEEKNNLPEAVETAKEEPKVEAKTLTIYSGRSEKLVAPLIENFKKASGIEVNVKYGKSGELAGTLLEEGDKSPADIFWAQDAGTLGVVAQKGMLAKLDDAALNKVPENFRAADGLWVGTSGRSRVLVYNTKNVKVEDLPKGVMELTDAKWKGKVGWAPTNASFQSFVAAMIELEGEEATKKWLEGMVANEPKVYPKNTPAVAATGAGEVDVALVNHYYLFRIKKEKGDDFPAANHFFKNEKAGQLVNVSGLSTLKSAKNAESAKAFVEYVLSEDGQKYFAQETYEYPVISGVKPYESLPALEEIKPPKVDFAKLANLEATIKLLRETKALK